MNDQTVLNILPVLPIVLALLIAVIAMSLSAHRQIQRAVCGVGMALHLLATSTLLWHVSTYGILVTQVGSWQAPFGISIVVDLFSGIMLTMTSIVGLGVVVFSYADVDETRRRFGYYPVMMVLIMGVSGAFSTGDLFNLYVWFEVMLIASFVLVSLGNERAQLEGGLKYFALNMIKSSLFLTAIGILYGISGTLNMADLALKVPQIADQGMVRVAATLLLIAFGIKAAAFPFFFWLPASYHTPPVAVTTLFSGLMTKVGVYALIRTFTLIFPQEMGFMQPLILGGAALTMILGVLGAVAQYDFRRLLAFHIISQIGYLLMGLGIFTVASLTGTIYFLVHVIVAKSALFLVSGASAAISGHYDLKQLGGYYRALPLLSFLFFLPAMALAGIPPLSGFWAKLLLIIGGLEASQYGVVAVALGVSVLTMFSMIKIWAEAFLKPSPSLSEEYIRTTAHGINLKRKFALFAPLMGLALLTAIIGIGAQPLIELSTLAAEQLIDTGAYTQAVLGNGAITAEVALR